jgi:hypothetical protein
MHLFFRRNMAFSVRKKSKLKRIPYPPQILGPHAAAESVSVYLPETPAAAVTFVAPKIIRSGMKRRKTFCFPQTGQFYMYFMMRRGENMVYWV